MKKAWIRQKGSQVEVIDATVPHVANGQFLIRMHSAALNFADLLMAEGSYQDTPPYPFIPGIEGAGEILAAPPDSSFIEGDRVLYWGRGALAQYVVADRSQITPLPASIGWHEAAGFQVAYGTSHLALTARGGLSTDEVLVVLGAAGGVGLTAVEIGKALGARVIGLARGADKAEAVLAAGADIALDTNTIPSAELRDAIRSAATSLGAEGVDVVYDPVGGEHGLAAFGALKRGGRFLLIGFAAGKPPALPLNHALVKNIAIHGFYWGGYRDIAPEKMKTSMIDALDMARKQLITPRAPTVFSLDNISEGYEMLRARRQIGKIVIEL